MVIPGIIIETILGSGLNRITSGILNIFFMSFVVIAPTEELLKFFAVKRWIYRSLEFDEIMDGIVYTVAASLGFATVENIIYVITHGITVGIARAFLAVPGHAFFGAIMGFYLGRAKFNREKEKKLIIKGILLAIFFHGLYDFLVLTQTVLALLVIIVIVVLGLVVKRELKKAEKQSMQRLEEEKDDVMQKSQITNVKPNTDHR
jgi:RsiW-degrading membrane proteinase PrsW (M82 family)